MEKIRIVLKAKENSLNTMQKQSVKAGTVALSQKKDTAESAGQEVQAV